ncbi:MAG TPA: hypothetical protein GX706_01030 [Candidatus Moranbacteria bacterium]|nr:hypothetical protein [Candidatus Moranbacteria bacterium]
MIINANELAKRERLAIARKIVEISHVPGSSLLSRSQEGILADIDSGVVLVSLYEDNPSFTVAFEPTGHPDYVEVGMTCNLAKEKVRGRDLFPRIIDHYIASNAGSRFIYLTTNDKRMVSIGRVAGFSFVDNLQHFFPPEVRSFCCSPCPKEKTGVVVEGQQKDYCPRFSGEFIPILTEEVTRMRCIILAREIK